MSTKSTLQGSFIQWVAVVLMITVSWGAQAHEEGPLDSEHAWEWEMPIPDIGASTETLGTWEMPIPDVSLPVDPAQTQDLPSLEPQIEENEAN